MYIYLCGCQKHLSGKAEVSEQEDHQRSPGKNERKKSCSHRIASHYLSVRACWLPHSFPPFQELDNSSKRPQRHGFLEGGNHAVRDVEPLPAHGFFRILDPAVSDEPDSGPLAAFGPDGLDDAVRELDAEDEPGLLLLGGAVAEDVGAVVGGLGALRNQERGRERRAVHRADLAGRRIRRDPERDVGGRRPGAAGCVGAVHGPNRHRHRRRCSSGAARVWRLGGLSLRSRRRRNKDAGRVRCLGRRRRQRRRSGRSRGRRRWWESRGRRGERWWRRGNIRWRMLASALLPSNVVAVVIPFMVVMVVMVMVVLVVAAAATSSTAVVVYDRSIRSYRLLQLVRLLGVAGTHS